MSLPTPSSPWPLYAFDNHFEHADHPVPDPDRWDIARDLGFSKLWLSINFTMPERVARMRRIPLDRDRTGLGVIVYTILDLQNPFPAAPNVFDLIDHLRPGDTLELALSLGWKRDLSDPAHDRLALVALEKILPVAEARGIIVSLYHHTGFWLETIEDAVRLARAFAHPRLKVTFCASHWYCLRHADPAADLSSAIALASPWLHLVNTCGTRPTPAGSSFPLPTTVEVLGAGTFDQAALLFALLRHGFAGDLGFQGYGIPGDPRQNLAACLRAYHALLPADGGAAEPLRSASVSSFPHRS